MTTVEASEPAIAAAVIVRDGKVLLIQRRLREGSLLWALPSGGIEDGETAPDAARRETLEEVGLVVSPTHVLGERVHPNTGRRMVYVACSAANGTAVIIDHDEIADLRWTAEEDLPQLVPTGFFGPVEDYLNAKMR